MFFRIALLTMLFAGTYLSAEVKENINDKNFASLTEEGVVIVDFYADWCGPCRKFAPTFAEVSDEFDGTCAFYKLNVDRAPKVSDEFNIQSIPTLVVFKNGQEVQRVKGGLDKEALKNLVKSHI